jgi:hypothetical protein
MQMPVGDPGEMVPAQKTDSPDPEIFTAFQRWQVEWAANPTGALEKSGEDLARQRRVALGELIETNPEKALALAVPYEVRKQLPASIVRHLEERIAGQGRYEVIARLPDPKKDVSASIERYVTLNDRTFKAYVYGRRASQTYKESIPLHGIAIDNAMAVAEHSVRVLSEVEAADLFAASAGVCPISGAPGERSVAAQIGDKVEYFCHSGHIETLNAEFEQSEEGIGPLARQSNLQAQSWSQGTKTLLLIRVTFPDVLTESTSIETAEQLMRQANAFFVENSYGKLTLKATVTSLITMPNPRSYYAQFTEDKTKFREVLGDARVAAASAGFATGDFDLDCVLVTGNVIGGFGYVGGKGATVPSPDVGAVCHELGHNLGLWHANAWRTSDGSIIGEGKNAEYENRFDTMGDSTFASAYNVCHKFKLGWLPESAISRIREDGVYRLYPSDVGSIDEGRMYALQIAKDDQRDYWIETRQVFRDHAGNNGDLLFNWSPWSMSGTPMSNEGTQLLDMTPKPGGGFFDAPLRFGQAFYDTEKGLKIVAVQRYDTIPPSIDVEVKHTHYFAAGSQLVGNPGGAMIEVEVLQDGDYYVWCQLAGPGGFFPVSVDDVTATVLLDARNANKTGWSRVVDSGGLPKLFTLAAGRHSIGIAPGENRIEAVLVTDDIGEQLPPVFAKIPDQVSIEGNGISIPLSVVMIGKGKDTIGLKAKSSNSRLVPDEKITIQGDWPEQRIEISPVDGELGSATIMLTATRADGVLSTTTFVLTVTGELQALVNAAGPGETVYLAGRTYFGNVVIDKEVTLEGAADGETILDARQRAPAVVITSNSFSTLRNLTIRNGRGGIRNEGITYLVACTIEQNRTSGKGGGIWNTPGAELYLDSCTLSSNNASFEGGAIYNGGDLHLINSTVSGNRSIGREGGGIYNSGVFVSYHNTIAYNRATHGGGIVNRAVTEIGNTIIARNIADKDQNADLSGEFLSIGFNLIQETSGATLTGETGGNILGLDPRLEPLQKNGGRTMTHALQPDSPALDAGDAEGSVLDQRGVPRPSDWAAVVNVSDGSDIGAFELASPESHIAPSLSIHRMTNGDVVITLAGGAGASWVVQATEDFVSWETVGYVQNAQTPAEITDAPSSSSANRFYRASKY